MSGRLPAPRRFCSRCRKAEVRDNVGFDNKDHPLCTGCWIALWNWLNVGLRTLVG